MSAGTLINVFEGNITKEGKVAFAGGEYDCDLTQLYGGAYLKEGSILVIADGEELDLSGHEVIVEVPVKAVSMSDDRMRGVLVEILFPSYIKETTITIQCVLAQKTTLCWMRMTSGMRTTMSVWSYREMRLD